MSICSPQSGHSPGTEGASPIEPVTGWLWPPLNLELAGKRIAPGALPLFSGELPGTAAADH
jgi:hypothetical protein